MSQKLNVIKQFINSIWEDVELSFNYWLKVIGIKEKLNHNNIETVKSKYKDIQKEFEWVKIFTSFNNKMINYILKINLHKKSWKYLQKLKNILRLPSGSEVELYTIFIIKEKEVFIISLLNYLDRILNLESKSFSISKQKEKIKELLNQKNNDFWKDMFTIQISIDEYLKDNIQYHTRLLEEEIKISNIVIFNWIITFHIQKNQKKSKKENKTNIISYYEEWNNWILSKWENKKIFNSWSLPHSIFIELLELENWEYIFFTELIEKFENISIEDLPIKKRKKLIEKIEGSIWFINKDIREKLKIEEFLKVENRAVKRQYEVEIK